MVVGIDGPVPGHINDVKDGSVPAEQIVINLCLSLHDFKPFTCTALVM